MRQRRFPPADPPVRAQRGAIAVIVVALVAVTAAPQTGLISFAAPGRAGAAQAARTDLDLDHARCDHAGRRRVATAPMAPKVALAPGEAPRVLIFGDSAALTLGDGLVKWGPATGQLQVWDAGKLGLPASVGVAPIRYLGQVIHDYGYCDWTTTLPQEISADPAPGRSWCMFGTWDVSDRHDPRRHAVALASVTRSTTSGSAARSPTPSTP